MAAAPERQPEPQPPQELSLRALSEAFAQAMSGQGVLPAEQPGAGPATVSEADQGLASGNPPLPEQSLEDEAAPDGDPVEISPASILEAMLFVGNRANEPLTPAEAASAMRGVQPEDVPCLVEQLNRRYKAGARPYHVARDGPGYRLTLRGAYGPLRNLFYGRAREAKLSQAAIDVLAIVAYQQPVTSEQVSQVRGKPSGAIVAQLVRRQLLRVERPPEHPRKPLHYTTDRFLALFGLESLDDLPHTEDVEKK